MNFAARILLAGLCAFVCALPATWVAAQTPADPRAGQTVRVVGVVRDDTNAMTLPGVPVEVVGTKQVVYTDVDGRYLLQLPLGTHELSVQLEGYQEKRVTLTAGTERTVTADIGLTMARFSETVTVTAQAIDVETSSAEAQIIERRNAQVITDNIGRQEMSANADGNAAAAMQRVTGLSVVDDFVFVRGLGERYSNTTLNGSVIPTTEPDRKVVPLDLFPSGLIDSVQVIKSYVPDRSAEFAGGLVEIEPLKFPAGPTVDASWSIGVNSLTSGKSILGYAGGGRDWVGFDDGTRALPSSVPDRKVIRGGIYTPDVGMLRSELARIGRSFDNSRWTPTTRTGQPSQSGSFLVGNRFNGRLGVLLSVSQSYSEQRREELQNYYRTGESGLSLFNEYAFDIATTRASTGLVGNLAYQVTPAHRLALENFYTHSGKDEARRYTGFNSDLDDNVRSTRLYWIEERLLFNTLSGDHFFRNAGNSALRWRVSYAAANRDEPDLRDVIYQQNGDVFEILDQSQSGFRMFNALDDTTKSAAADWSAFGTQWSRLPVQYKVGVSYVDRDRDFSSRRFRYVPIDLSGLDLTLPPEQLFVAANIGSKFEFREETRATDAYDARQESVAVYAMTDLSLTSRTRLVGGLRVERFNQQVNTFDLFDVDDDPELIPARLENTDVFPGVNLVQALSPSTNLRIGFSQTVNRPEFRELAPFEFTDITGGRATVGNPNLTRALIRNVDVRWEMFPGADEVVAASVFYKHFDDPIERIVEPTAQLRTSFTNADAARNFGVELEARRRVSDVLLVGANYTFVDSKITLSPAAAQVQTSLERALTGQSRNLFNALAQAGNSRVTARLLYNFFGKRISDVGSEGLPDIFEDGRGALDLVVSTRWRRLTVRFSGENLTDGAITFTQAGLDQRSYTLGRTFAVNFGLAAFYGLCRANRD